MSSHTFPKIFQMYAKTGRSSRPKVSSQVMAPKAKPAV